MQDIIQTAAFKKWRETLKDPVIRALIASRLDRLAFGHSGDTVLIGNGVSELRIHYGSGFRVYFIRQGRCVVVLLTGGDKGSQSSDIKKAYELAEKWRKDHA